MCVVIKAFQLLRAAPFTSEWLARWWHRYKNNLQIFSSSSPEHFTQVTCQYFQWTVDVVCKSCIYRIKYCHWIPRSIETKKKKKKKIQAMLAKMNQIPLRSSFMRNEWWCLWMVLSMHLVLSPQAVFDASRNKMACGTHFSRWLTQHTQIACILEQWSHRCCSASVDQRWSSSKSFWSPMPSSKLRVWVCFAISLVCLLCNAQLCLKKGLQFSFKSCLGLCVVLSVCVCACLCV